MYRSTKIYFIVLIVLITTFIYIKITNFSLLIYTKEQVNQIPFEEYLKQNTIVYLEKPINRGSDDDRDLIEIYVGLAKVDDREVVKYFYYIPTYGGDEIKANFIIGNGNNNMLRKAIETNKDVYGEIKVDSCDTSSFSYSGYRKSDIGYNHHQSGYFRFRCDITPIYIKVQLDLLNENK